ncbi:unnamed protein product [Caenorhabditis angaria]|uniref:Uncharacterized protein n=1 Tax=Caenorhabditis angaria TaxID=860376 RepID=B6VC12_9PELO|nr:hypothetical protein Csp3_JD07.005 [Caenorhabditis angaria]CAI5446339.1 unnamed protein product [Caenorhabditis angaria]
METLLVSNNAMEIDALNRAIIYILRQTRDCMRRPIRISVYDILLHGIGDIHIVLTNSQVRGNLDERLRTPVVTHNSSWNSLYVKLQNLTTCACILADSIHSDPEATSAELTASDRIKFAQRIMFSKISLARELMDFCY